MKRKNGITIIALVITIIVILILAGVTIATLTGDNGLLQKAQTAKETNEDGKELELIELAVAASKVEGEGTLAEDDLTHELRANFNDNSITLTELPQSNGWRYNEYKIYKDGKVEKTPNKKWLFNNRQNIVGNWDAKPYRSHWGVTHKDGSQIFNYRIEDNMFKITGKMYKCGIVYLTDIIDFSDWNKVYINVTSTDSIDGSVVLVKKDGLKDDLECYIAIEAMNEGKLYSADISDINEECYIGLYAGGMTYFNFDELYLTI